MDALGIELDWLVILLLALAAVLVALHHDLWRRLLLRWEDPRTMALFRIAWGVCAIYWLVDLVPLLDYLFSDEGMYSTEAAREAFAASAFAGYGDGSSPDAPAGFFDIVAFVQWLGHPRRSLLFFWDSPSAVHVHCGALLFATLAFTLGLCTRLAKWISLLLLWSLVDRNTIFWAGEQIFLNFGLFLCLSRCGHAYSVDEWWRARRLRARASRSEVMLRPIPAWPRVLAMLQVLPLMSANGLAKSGRHWLEGDVLHYMVANPEFSRFDPGLTISLLPTALFPLFTWLVHSLEILYPLVFVGVVLRFRRRSGIAPLSGWRRLLARATWIAVAGTCILLVLAVFEGRERATLSFVLPIAVACLAIAIALVGPHLGVVRIGRRRFDVDWFSRWFLGRRVWLSAQVLFMAHLCVLCDFGAFVPLSLATSLVFLEGREVAILVSRLGRRRSTIAPVHVGPEPVRSLAAAPLGAIVLFIVVVAAAVAATGPSDALWPLALLAAGLVFAVLVRLRSRGMTEAARGEARRGAAVGWFVTFHVCAVALVCLPRAHPPSVWRQQLERPLHRWLDQVHAWQFWRMFAPNGAPVRWTVLSSVVETPAGDRVEMDSRIPGLSHASIGLGRAKARKAEQRISEVSPTIYAKWHGRWLCRRWAVDHGGSLPREIVLVRTRRPIPPPEAYRDFDAGARTDLVDDGTVRDEFFHTYCDVDVEAQLSPEIRIRHGLPPAPSTETFRPWLTYRDTFWPRKREAGEVPDLPWPLFIVGVPVLLLLLPRRR